MVVKDIHVLYFCKLAHFSLKEKEECVRGELLKLCKQQKTSVPSENNLVKCDFYSQNFCKLQIFVFLQKKRFYI